MKMDELEEKIGLVQRITEDHHKLLSSNSERLEAMEGTRELFEARLDCFFQDVHPALLRELALSRAELQALRQDIAKLQTVVRRELPARGGGVLSWLRGLLPFRDNR